MFVAVTTTRSVAPTSPASTMYDDAVAPGMSKHELPTASHVRHT